ncbi:MAG: hypothetical protein WBG24_18305, partial [Syntrophobacteria bacterium]
LEGRTLNPDISSRPGVTATTSGFQIEGCLIQTGYLSKTIMQSAIDKGQYMRAAWKQKNPH